MQRTTAKLWVTRRRHLVVGLNVGVMMCRDDLG